MFLIFTVMIYLWLWRLIILFDRFRMCWFSDWMDVRSVRFDHRFEAAFCIRRVVNGAYRTVRLQDAVVTLDDTIISGFPLRFYITGMQILDAVTERIGGMMLSSLFGVWDWKRFMHVIKVNGLSDTRHSIATVMGSFVGWGAWSSIQQLYGNSINQWNNWPYVAHSMQHALLCAVASHFTKSPRNNATYIPTWVVVVRMLCAYLRGAGNWKISWLNYGSKWCAYCD